jgi:hypothetical protein
MCWQLLFFELLGRHHDGRDRGAEVVDDLCQVQVDVRFELFERVLAGKSTVYEKEDKCGIWLRKYLYVNHLGFLGLDHEEMLAGFL